jgi:hypothetical protein
LGLGFGWLRDRKLIILPILVYAGLKVIKAIKVIKAWLLAARASKIAVTAKSSDLWGWLFQHDHSSNVVLPKAS